MINQHVRLAVSFSLWLNAPGEQAQMTMHGQAGSGPTSSSYFDGFCLSWTCWICPRVLLGWFPQRKHPNVEYVKFSWWISRGSDLCSDMSSSRRTGHEIRLRSAWAFVVHWPCVFMDVCNSPLFRRLCLIIWINKTRNKFWLVFLFMVFVLMWWYFLC